MKFGKFALLTSATLAISMGAQTNAQAITLVNQALDVFVTPAANEPVFTLTEQGTSGLPFVTPLLTTGATNTVDVNNNVNDLDEAIGDIVYRLLSPDAQFGTVTSNIYTVLLSEDNKVATFKGGRIEPGQGFRIERSINDGSSVDFTVSLSPANETNTATVPEPATMLGLVVVGVGGACLRQRRK